MSNTGPDITNQSPTVGKGLDVGVPKVPTEPLQPKLDNLSFEEKAQPPKSKVILPEASAGPLEARSTGQVRVEERRWTGTNAPAASLRTALPPAEAPNLYNEQTFIWGANHRKSSKSGVEVLEETYPHLKNFIRSNPSIAANAAFGALVMALQITIKQNLQACARGAAPSKEVLENFNCELQQNLGANSTLCGTVVGTLGENGRRAVDELRQKIAGVEVQRQLKVVAEDILNLAVEELEDTAKLKREQIGRSLQEESREILRCLESGGFGSTKLALLAQAWEVPMTPVKDGTRLPDASSAGDSQKNNPPTENVPTSSERSSPQEPTPDPKAQSWRHRTRISKELAGHIAEVGEGLEHPLETRARGLAWERGSMSAQPEFPKRDDRLRAANRGIEDLRAELVATTDGALTASVEALLYREEQRVRYLTISGAIWSLSVQISQVHAAAMAKPILNKLSAYIQGQEAFLDRLPEDLKGRIKTHQAEALAGTHGSAYRQIESVEVNDYFYGLKPPPRSADGNSFTAGQPISSNALVLAQALRSEQGFDRILACAAIFAPGEWSQIGELYAQFSGRSFVGQVLNRLVDRLNSFEKRITAVANDSVRLESLQGEFASLESHVRALTPALGVDGAEIEMQLLRLAAAFEKRMPMSPQDASSIFHKGSPVSLVGGISLPEKPKILKGDAALGRAKDLRDTRDSSDPFFAVWQIFKGLSTEERAKTLRVYQQTFGQDYLDEYKRGRDNSGGIGAIECAIVEALAVSAQVSPETMLFYFEKRASDYGARRGALLTAPIPNQTMVTLLDEQFDQFRRALEGFPGYGEVGSTLQLTKERGEVNYIEARFVALNRECGYEGAFNAKTEVDLDEVSKFGGAAELQRIKKALLEREVAPETIDQVAVKLRTNGRERAAAAERLYAELCMAVPPERRFVDRLLLGADNEQRFIQTLASGLDGGRNRELARQLDRLVAAKTKYVSMAAYIEERIVGTFKNEYCCDRALAIHEGRIGDAQAADAAYYLSKGMGKELQVLLGLIKGEAEFKQFNKTFVERYGVKFQGTSPERRAKSFEDAFTSTYYELDKQALLARVQRNEAKAKAIELRPLVCSAASAMETAQLLMQVRDKSGRLDVEMLRRIQKEYDLFPRGPGDKTFAQSLCVLDSAAGNWALQIFSGREELAQAHQLRVAIERGDYQMIEELFALPAALQQEVSPSLDKQSEQALELAKELEEYALRRDRLKQNYARLYPDHPLDAEITKNVPAVYQTSLRLCLGDGRLEPEDLLYFAMKKERCFLASLGTDEATIGEIFFGRRWSKDEIRRLGEAYTAKYGAYQPSLKHQRFDRRIGDITEYEEPARGRDLVSDLGAEISGNQWFDVKYIIEHGTPTSLVERIDWIRARYNYDLDSSACKLGLVVIKQSSYSPKTILAKLELYQSQIKAGKTLNADEQTQLEGQLRAMEVGLDVLRGAKSVIAEGATQLAVVVAGTGVCVISGGMGTPLLTTAMLAGAGMGAARVGTKYFVEGASYDREELYVDVAGMPVVDFVGTASGMKVAQVVGSGLFGIAGEMELSNLNRQVLGSNAGGLGRVLGAPDEGALAQYVLGGGSAAPRVLGMESAELVGRKLVMDSFLSRGLFYAGTGALAGAPTGGIMAAGYGLFDEASWGDGVSTALGASFDRAVQGGLQGAAFGAALGALIMWHRPQLVRMGRPIKAAAEEKLFARLNDPADLAGAESAVSVSTTDAPIEAPLLPSGRQWFGRPELQFNEIEELVGLKKSGVSLCNGDLELRRPLRPQDSRRLLQDKSLAPTLRQELQQRYRARAKAAADGAEGYLIERDLIEVLKRANNNLYVTKRATLWKLENELTLGERRLEELQKLADLPSGAADSKLSATERNLFKHIKAQQDHLVKIREEVTLRKANGETAEPLAVPEAPSVVGGEDATWPIVRLQNSEAGATAATEPPANVSMPKGGTEGASEGGADNYSQPFKNLYNELEKGGGEYRPDPFGTDGGEGSGAGLRGAGAGPNDRGGGAALRPPAAGTPSESSSHGTGAKAIRLNTGKDSGSGERALLEPGNTQTGVVELPVGQVEIIDPARSRPTSTATTAAPRPSPGGGRNAATSAQAAAGRGGGGSVATQTGTGPLGDLRADFLEHGARYLGRGAEEPRVQVEEDARSTTAAQGQSIVTTPKPAKVEPVKVDPMLDPVPQRRAVPLSPPQPDTLPATEPARPIPLPPKRRIAPANPPPLPAPTAPEPQRFPSPGTIPAPGSPIWPETTPIPGVGQPQQAPAEILAAAVRPGVLSISTTSPAGEAPQVSSPVPQPALEPVGQPTDTGSVTSALAPPRWGHGSPDLLPEDSASDRRKHIGDAPSVDDRSKRVRVRQRGQLLFRRQAMVVVLKGETMRIRIPKSNSFGVENPNAGAEVVINTFETQAEVARGSIFNNPGSLPGQLLDVDYGADEVAEFEQEE